MNQAKTPIDNATQTARTPSETWIALLLAVATAGLCVLNAHRMPFMDPDEGRCVLIAKQMIDSGDWLVPRTPFGDPPYFDKPVLYFWLLAGAFRVFGVNELTARLVSALAAGLMIAGTFRLGRILLSPRAALWSAIFLATTALTTIAGRFVRMDVWLTALVTWGVYFWCRVHFAGAPRRNLVYGYVCLAGGCLTKGLVGVFLPLAAIGAFLLMRRRPDWSVLRRANLPLGAAIVVALTAPWFAYMNWRFPEYLVDFFIRHHLLRATTDTFGRGANPLYLPGMLLAGFLPWTIFLLVALGQALRHLRDAQWRDERRRLLLCYWWAVIGVIPFMIFRTKLPVYIMPAFPALALIAGDYAARLLERPTPRERRWVFGLTLVLMALCLATLAIANHLTFSSAIGFILLRRTLVFLPAAFFVLHRAWTGRAAAALRVAVVMTLALIVDVAWVEGPGMAEHLSSRRLAPPIAAQANDIARIIMGPDPRYAVFCYLPQPVPVQYLEHKRDFESIEEPNHPVLALLTDAGLVRRAQVRYGDHLTILGQGPKCWLIRLDPGG